MAVSEFAQALLSQALKELSDAKLDVAEQKLLELQATGEREDAVHHNLGVIAVKRGQIELAVQHMERTIFLNPHFIKAHTNLASAYLELGRNEEALSCCGDALALNPNDHKAHNNKAIALRRLLRPMEALDAALMAVRLDAANATYLCSLATTLQELNRHHDSLACYNCALALDPQNLDLRFGRAAVLLQLGIFRQGFEDYELRWDFGGNKTRLTEHRQPRWVGQINLTGRTILMQTEQGIGDNIQFARYASALAARGAKVVLQVRKELVALFKGFPDTVAVVAEGDELPPFDCFVPMMSLPLLLGTQLDTIPSNVPYLHAPLDRLTYWRAKIGSDVQQRQRPRIGIAWSGSPTHKGDKERSIPLVAFPIPNPEHFDVHSLQKHVRTSDQSLLDRLSIHQHGVHLGDMADTAALIECLDLVICVDTSVAHLAGALGRRVWLLLPSKADWRWLHNRSDSPWYPGTMRIFQQQAPGDWKSVFDQVAVELAELLK